jgi:hypothetical protein
MLPSAQDQLRVAEEMFPQVVVRGLLDYSCNIHSFGCSYWTALGQREGFSALCEVPAPNSGVAAMMGDNVISDSAWFTKTKDDPEVLVEFERYSDASDEMKLLYKAQNLLLGYWRWNQQPKLLVLAYWTKGLRNLPDHNAMRQNIRKGFCTVARESVPGTRTVTIRFLQFVFEEMPSAKWKLTRIIERGIE